MTNEELMLTSEITDRLQHSSPAVTRDWIRRRGLEVKGRDKDTGEKQYSRTEVEEKIAEMPRGPYRRGDRPDQGARRDDDDGRAHDQL